MVPAAADQGHAEACLKLGQAYEAGEGGAQDKAEADKWFRLAKESEAQGPSVTWLKIGAYNP